MQTDAGRQTSYDRLTDNRLDAILWMPSLGLGHPGGVPMSGSFLVALLVSLILLIYWRVALVLLAAILIAVLATGVDAIANGVAGVTERPASVAPADPTLQTQPGEAPR